MQTTTSTTSHNRLAGVGVGIASARDIDAPPDIVWDAVTDIEARPRYWSRVRTVERLDGSKQGEPLKVGSRYRVVTDDYAADVTVTSIRDGGDYPRSIAYVGNGHRNDVANARTHSTTTTFAVEPIEGDERRCRLYMSFAIVPQGKCARVFMTACSCLCLRRVNDTVDVDMGDIAMHAEEKAREKARDAELKQEEEDTNPKEGGNLQRATTA